MAAGSNNIVTDGLIFCADPANKRCYSGSGDTCTDLAGGVTGDFVNDTSLSSDWNGVFDFDGTDDYIDFGSPAALQNQVGTVIGWGRWDETNTDQGGLVSYLYAHGSLAHGWNLLNHGTYKIGRSLAGSHYDYWTGSSSYKFDKDEWVMASFSFAGNSNPVITYRNDVAINTDSSQGTTVTYTGAKVLIGRTDVSAYREWRGQIGPVYIYNRVLTQDEITQMYEALKPRFTPRIAKRGMNLNFDAGDPASYPGGTSWKDTANGLSTTFHNMDASNFNSSNGGYFAFDGTDEYMSVLNSPLFQGAIADQGTFAAWFNIDEAGDDADPNIAIWGAGRNGSKMTWTMAQFDSSKKPLFGAYLGGSWSDIGVADTALSYDTWYYVVFTWDKANTQVKSYVNGALDDTDTTSSASITTSTAGWLGIGASLYNTTNGNTPYNFLPGFIGVLQLYDSVLSAAEIMDNFQKTRGRFGV